jgi:hypothetical protein
LPIYGKKVLDEKPYHVTLKDDSIWIVEGTFHGGDNQFGGVAYAEIQKKDCKILKIIHGK